MTNFEEMSRLSHIKQIALDVADVSTKKYLDAKQNDINSRFLEIIITEELKPKTIPDDVAVMLRGTKANGNNFLDEGFISNGKIYVDLSSVISVAGRAKCDINLTDSKGSISTVTFYVEVAAQPFDENAVIESEEFSALNDALLRIENATKNETDRVNAEKARVTAESGRVQAEKDRVSAEASRVAAEETRSGNEENRVTSEEERAAAELIRGENEAARVSAENTRKTNEENRVSAEAKRQAAYANFQNDIDDNEIAAGLILNHSRQVQWKVDDFLKTDIGTVTLTNTLEFPFNNSIQSVALSDERLNTDYIVITELVSADGVAGEIEVSDKLVNGFKIAYTGSASSVTIKYVVMGGYSV